MKTRCKLGLNGELVEGSDDDTIGCVVNRPKKQFIKIIAVQFLMSDSGNDEMAVLIQYSRDGCVNSVAERGDVLSAIVAALNRITGMSSNFVESQIICRRQDGGALVFSCVIKVAIDDAVNHKRFLVHGEYSSSDPTTAQVGAYLAALQSNFS